MKNALRTRITLRTLPKFVLITFSFSFLALGIFFIFYFTNNRQAYGAVTGDYRSIATGNWNLTSTWETFNGTTWVAAATTPTSSNNVITIQNNNTVTVSANVTADQVVVEAGGNLNITSGKTLTLADGTGVDLTVNGSMTINGSLAVQASSSISDNGNITLSLGGSNTYAAGATITINSNALYKAQDNSFTGTSGIWTINSGGTFQYDDDAGSLPFATWNTGSTCLVSGITGVVPGNLTQPFYNFIWNCPNQTGTEKLSGNLTTVNGDFTMISSGTGRLRFTQQESFTLTVGGNFYVQGGLLYVSCKGAADSILVAGNYVQTGGTFGLTDGTTEGGITPTYMSITNFTLSNGTFDMTSNVGNSSGNGVTTLVMNGMFSQTGGTFTETASTGANYGYGNVYFIKQGTQTFERGTSTMSNTVNFTVSSGSILNLLTSYPTGSGSFTVASGGALIMASPDGITSSGSTGNVQVTGARSFSTSANYTYNATSSQVTGNGLPATINNLTIDNSSHVVLTNTTTVSGILTLWNGQLITNANEIVLNNSATSSITNYSSSNYIRGNLRRYVNSGGSYDFPVGTSSYSELLNVNLSGMTGFTNILCSFTNANPINPSYPLSDVVINGTVVDLILNYGYWTVTPNSSMTGGSYSITLKETGHTNPAGTPASYCVLKRANINSYWQSLGTHSSSTQSEINGVASALRSGLTSFSQFGIGRNSGIGGLPIKLLNFTIQQNKEAVVINWSTASEINNNYFTVERSKDGLNFEELHRVAGAGNSTIIHNYSDADAQPLHGVSYYRLKQTDYDGHFTYSAIKSVKYSAGLSDQNNVKLISIGPNPFNETFNVNFESRSASTKNIRLINSFGQIVFEEQVHTDSGINQYNYSDNLNLPAGIYVFEIESDGERIVKQIIKK